MYRISALNCVQWHTDVYAICVHVHVYTCSGAGIMYMYMHVHLYITEAPVVSVLVDTHDVCV